MYPWLKYIAYGLIVLLCGYFLYDLTKTAKSEGGSWLRVLVRILIWILVFAMIVAVNYWINRNWIPGKWMFTIGF